MKLPSANAVNFDEVKILSSGKGNGSQKIVQGFFPLSHVLEANNVYGKYIRLQAGICQKQMGKGEGKYERYIHTLSKTDDLLCYILEKSCYCLSED